MAEFGHVFAMNAKLPLHDNFANFANTNELFEEKLQKLISGLDKDSIETVYRILSRLKIAVANENRIFRDLTKQEIDTLNEHYTRFYPNIFEVIPGKKYYYNGYYLPTNVFSTHVFWDHFGLKRKGVIADMDCDTNTHLKATNLKANKENPPLRTT